MRVDKTIKGEVIPYQLKFLPNTMTVEVRYWRDDEPVIGTLSKDFKRINMPEGFLSRHISGFGRLPIKYFSLNKYLKSHAKDYNVK